MTFNNPKAISKTIEAMVNQTPEEKTKFIFNFSEEMILVCTAFLIKEPPYAEGLLDGLYFASKYQEFIEIEQLGNMVK
jgi:hypothetical protein